ncbi:ABC transporter substrate-binding protein [Fulvivirga lutimaris]|uniref:ABC transporter substrate-binding protein n=1 Tax=Fulvivirga lutimaris TaxID=1819566 RepID=UPI0012BB5BBB|nr:ABC transporter substrate-binding protein [Fulvivirga lutimaris]MTI40286.1 vitamin B12-transporter protein BtuF [Fulvivirga lutimaris]
MSRSLLLILFIGLISCTQKSAVDEENNAPNKVLELKYATGFAIEYYDGFKIVEVKKPYMNAKTSFKYVLVSDASKVPASLQNERIIEVPLKSIVCTSTTHIPLLDYLGETDKLIGFPTTDYISSEKMRARIDDGLVKDLGVDSDINLEELISIDPDMIMAYTIGGDYGQFNKMEQLGVPAVLNAEYLEEHPLGRAEWLKFMAAFFDKERMADSVFNSIEERYNELLALDKNNYNKPTILSGVVYGDTWYMPGGKNYASTLMRDAGGDYLWASDSTSGFLELSFEAVYEKALNADFWIGVASFETLQAIEEADNRYADFDAFKSKKIYTYNARKGAKGGSEFLELGYLRPDLILADLIKILCPNQLPEHELYFHKQLE